jgi:hypothetical protein
MDSKEFHAWLDFQKQNSGKWTVDPIHNGESSNSLLCYVAKPDDPGTGIYINVGQNGDWACGQFTGAIPHMGEALYVPSIWGKAGDFKAALSHLGNRLGLSFLHVMTTIPEGPFKDWS